MPKGAGDHDRLAAGCMYVYEVSCNRNAMSKAAHSHEGSGSGVHVYDGPVERSQRYMAYG